MDKICFSRAEMTIDLHTNPERNNFSLVRRSI